MAIKLLIVDAYTANGRKSAIDAKATCAGPLFERAVRTHASDADIDILEFDDAAAVPPASVPDYDGVIWSGSNLTIHRRNPLIDAQIALARALYDAKVPQFGCCYGIQLGAVAAGGDVLANPNGPEIGYARDVTLTDAGRAHPMYQGKAHRFDALCWHSDTVTKLPEEADLLASNENSRVQAAIFRRNGGEFWATQYHLEFDGYEIASLVTGYQNHLIKTGVFSDAEAVDAYADNMLSIKGWEADLANVPAELAAVSDPMIRTAEIGNWLKHLENQS